MSESQAIVIICAGRTFIAGADIKEFGKPALEPFLPDVVARIEACEKPVIAAIHGTALGGGFEVALGCHYRIALSSAAIGLPEVNLGLLPGATGTQRLPRLIGAEHALDIMLTGKPVRAGRALEYGALDKVVAGTDLRAAAISFAEDCVAKGPRRIRDMTVPEVDAGLFDTTRKKIAPKTRGLISPEKIIRAVELATKTQLRRRLCGMNASYFSNAWPRRSPADCAMRSSPNAALRRCRVIEQGHAAARRHQSRRHRRRNDGRRDRLQQPGVGTAGYASGYQRRGPSAW